MCILEPFVNRLHKRSKSNFSIDSRLKKHYKNKKAPAYLTSKQVAILLPLAYLSLRARARAFSVFLKWSLAVSLKTSGPYFLMSLAAKVSTLAPAPQHKNNTDLPYS